MPVKYIEVSAISDLFVAATRSFGDIAMVGTSTNTAVAVNLPTAFTDPITANATFKGDLGDAIGMAFKQSPAPTTIWGVRVDTAAPDWGAALDQVATLNVQIVALANQPLPASNAAVSKLSDHVTNTSSTGGDGKERIGVAMLAKGVTDPKAVTGSLVNERMVYIAHQSDQDAAAAVAGVIAGYEPHISILLKPVSIDMSTYFTDSQIAAYDANGSGGINWLTSPVLIPGHGLYMGEGYTGNAGGGKKYIDIVRTLDDISFRIKAALIETIGNFRVSRSGLRAVVTLVQAVLSPLQAREVIEGFSIYIPLLVLLDKDPTALSAVELTEIQKAQADRRVDMVVTCEYAGAIHRLHIDLVFK
jgi:hypothetical protein